MRQVSMFGKVILSLILLMVLAPGCSRNSTTVSDTGIVIKQATPDEAYTTYFELFNSKKRLAAYDLISPQNRKYASKKDFEEWSKTLPYKKEQLVYTASAEQGDLAVVGSVKIIDVYETKACLYSIFGLVKDNNKWYVEMNVEGLGEDKTKVIGKLSEEVHDRVLKAVVSKDIDLDDKYLQQVEGQIKAFKKSP